MIKSRKIGGLNIFGGDGEGGGRGMGAANVVITLEE